MMTDGDDGGLFLERTEIDRTGGPFGNGTCDPRFNFLPTDDRFLRSGYTSMLVRRLFTIRREEVRNHILLNDENRYISVRIRDGTFRYIRHKGMEQTETILNREIQGDPFVNAKEIGGTKTAALFKDPMLLVPASIPFQLKTTKILIQVVSRWGTFADGDTVLWKA